MKNKEKRLLLISYFYPPLGGPGVQRPCKLVHYLRKKSWIIDVISVKKIEFHSIDETLSAECDENNLYKVNSFDPMRLLYLIKKYFGKNGKQRKSQIKSPQKKLYFHTPERIKRIIRGLFPIDDKIGWLPFAYRAGTKLCNENKYDAVMATIGPYTSAVIAYKIAKRFHIPLVIDYRDLWTQHPYLTYISPFHKKYSEYWEKCILVKAKVITTVSKSMVKSLCEKYGESLKDKLLVMYNAWDERDFKKVKVGKKIQKNNNKISFTYIGGFYGEQTPKYFIQAMEELQRQKRLPQQIEFIFVGNYFHEVIAILQNNAVRDFIKIIPQLLHNKAIEYILSADALLLFVSSINGEGVITGKIFEYIRSRNEILAMVPPQGEAAEILESSNHKFICAMENVEMIKKNFLKLYEDIRSNDLEIHTIDGRFNRENQTNKFETFLQKRIARR